MEEISINVLMDAKTEWTKQLTNILTIPIYEGFKSLYDDAIKETDPRYQEFSELQLFQEYLKKIPKWNQTIIDSETERIIQRTKVNYLDDVITTVFLCNVQVLSVVRLKNPDNEIDIKVPKVKNFIHRCYMECGREIYQNAYLFDTDDLPTYEIQKNNREILNIIKEGIIEAVRKLLPVKDIIKNYIGKINEETEDITIEKGIFREGSFNHIVKQNLKKGLHQIESEDEDEPSLHEEQPEALEEQINSRTLSDNIVNEIEENGSQNSSKSSINDDIISVNSQNQEQEKNIIEQEYSYQSLQNPKELQEKFSEYQENFSEEQERQVERPREYQERQAERQVERPREYQERQVERQVERPREYQERQAERQVERQVERPREYQEEREPVRYLPMREESTNEEVVEIMKNNHLGDKELENAYTKIVTMPNLEGKKKKRLRGDRKLLRSKDKHKLIVEKSYSPIQRTEVFKNVQNNLESEDENDAVFFADAPDRLESDFEEDDYSVPHQY